MSPRRGALGALALAVTLASLASGTTEAQAAKAKCAGKAPGGGWQAYGHDDSNTRHQPREHLISPENVGALEPAWTFDFAAVGGEGDVPGTPVVDAGCVYVASARGWIAALNAANGRPVWSTKISDNVFVYSSLGLTRNRVFVSVTRAQQGLTGCPEDDPCKGPFVAALDRRDGELLWASRPIDEQRGSESYASPVVVNGLVLVGISGGVAELTRDPATRDEFQGSLVFLDAGTGKLVHKLWTIHPPLRPDDDFAGAGIWGTPAVDRRRDLAWVGTANPYVPKAAHPHAGAVLKIDIDPDSRRFGKIVDFGEGTPEEYLEAFEDLPCIDIPRNVPPYPTGLGSCADFDLDIGASPNLFRGADGRLLVGAGQKSGVYHVFDAKTMERLRSTIVGPPSYFGGIVGSTAYDGHALYGPITIPGYLWSIEAAGGAQRWVAPILDVLHWGPPVAVANGVVYTVDYMGYLDAFDARDGSSLLRTPLAAGGESSGEGSWAGVSIARNTVYAAIGTGGNAGGVIAYRLPR